MITIEAAMRSLDYWRAKHPNHVKEDIWKKVHKAATGKAFITCVAHDELDKAGCTSRCCAIRLNNNDPDCQSCDMPACRWVCKYIGMEVEK